MSTTISQQILDLQAQIAEATEKKSSLDGKLRVLDELLGSISSQRQQYQLLDEICAPLEKMSKTGAADLFREATGYDPEKQLQQIRGVVAGFQQKISSVELSRGVLLSDSKDKLASINLLSAQLAQLQQKGERLKNAHKFVRQARETPHRVTALPWSSQGEDERLFRKIIIAISLVVIVFGGVIPFFKPPVEVSMGVVVPERIARIIKKKQEEKLEKQKLPEKIAEKKDEKLAEKTPEKVAEKTPEKTPEKIAEKAPEKTLEKAPSSATTKPIEPEVQIARKSAETKGVLAFKKDFADLLKDAPTSKMGADARLSNNVSHSSNDALQRANAVSKVTGGSGGINASALNRQGDASVAPRITDTEIKVAHVESAASTGASGADRPLSKAAGARTEEEIRVVFDQSQTALARIYQRELRSNPTLRGKMVLLVVIEPDGHVSACTVKSTDLPAALSADIVARVLKFNFGPKSGAPAFSFSYSIDFLPPN